MAEMINVNSAQIISNYTKDQKKYYIEIFYIDNGIQAFASFQENINKIGASIVGSGYHTTNKKLAIDSAIANLILQLN
ncbi:hypothetical protein M5V91_04870 [Cytobacillus pseudoceanisediminis]|uniref:hypothetical protein n=1 Tax=Cytobacillus pseudoceanisediminis TaxID=3051614 RepID=UPI00218B940E|nr:hypothetical protein [Cytobacillus pseudoceanisediminis]UQX55096.1 hypothetical protein M5V91_04870 [Cytobacillus pseudoceanisediminis]